MEIQRPLAVVTPTLDGGVLAVLARADAAFTTGQVANLLGDASRYGVRLVLQRLTDQGIVTSQRAGRAFLYRLNRDHLAGEAIIALAHQRETLLQRLTTAVAGWPTPPIYAAVFGSAARGDMRTDSDIDLFLVSHDDTNQDAWETLVTGLAAQVTRWTGNPAMPLTMTEAEVIRGARPTSDTQTLTDPILKEIAADAAVFAGPAQWLNSHIRKARRPR